MKIINVVGARPNFMKIAPLHRALTRSGRFESLIVHTGQHYDERMSDIFFRQLEMPQPDLYLGVGSGSHARQTAQIMTAFEDILIEEKPAMVIVVGDVNSTMACSLVAAKLHVPVAHVEAGLRSRDRSMPEEINRIVTDGVADYLFATEQDAVDNLLAEGVPAHKIYFVGNVMVDALVQFRDKAARTTILQELALRHGSYVLMTMHRPSNVDRPEGLERLLETIEKLAGRLAVVFPMHPRTRSRFAEFGLAQRLEAVENLTLLEPLGYLEFLRLMENAAVVVTDSGGVQEETTFLQVPCLTLRTSTERPVTVELGTNRLLDLDPDLIAHHIDTIRQMPYRNGQTPPLWDGKAAERIVAALEGILMPAHKASLLSHY